VIKRDHEDEVRLEIIELASLDGRYRTVCAMMPNKEGKINHKRVERIWR